MSNFNKKQTEKIIGEITEGDNLICCVVRDDHSVITSIGDKDKPIKRILEGAIEDIYSENHYDIDETLVKTQKFFEDALCKFLDENNYERKLTEFRKQQMRLNVIADDCRRAISKNKNLDPEEILDLVNGDISMNGGDL